MASGQRKPCRLRPSALDDLEAIWLYTAAQWSVGRADEYIRQVSAGLDLLTERPEIGRERRELNPPVRIYPVASHLVVYRIESDHLDIIRIRHVREDWENDPLGE